MIAAASIPLRAGAAACVRAEFFPVGATQYTEMSTFLLDHGFSYQDALWRTRSYRAHVLPPSVILIKPR